MSDQDLANLSALFKQPVAPLPSAALELLPVSAFGDTGGNVAARGFLFWLVGAPDPTGLVKDGALELRRWDARRKKAALELLRWWTGPTESDTPVYAVLEQLTRRFLVSKGTQDDE
jgi:hypothetical protein